MKLTKQYIMDNRTKRGAWTKPQIESLGIVWPPRKGWIDRIIGTEISLDQQAIFESKVAVKAFRRQRRQWASEEFSFEARKQDAINKHEATKNLDIQTLAGARKHEI